MRHVWTLPRSQNVKNQDDSNPDETAETRGEEREYRLKLTAGGVLLGLIKILIISVLVTAIIVFVTSFVVILPRVGLGGFIDYIVGQLTGHYSVLLPADAQSLRGDLESALFFEFLILLVIGLITVATLRTGGDMTPRAALWRRSRRLPLIPSKGKDTAQEDRRRKRRGGIGIEVIFLLVALLIIIALLLGLV
jgi:hypothetical protein